MLKRIEKYYELDFSQEWQVTMNAFDFSFHVSMTLEMEEIVVQLNLCAQEDGSRRISCFNRCGQPPEIKKTPGQCGCDPNCFLYNDCCEDMMVCPSVFYDAVKTFNEERQNLPESYCSKHKRSLLTCHSCSEHFNTSAKTVEMYCDSRAEPFNVKAFQNILVALNKRQCLTGSLSTDEPKASRFCNRPEVIACGKDESPQCFPRSIAVFWQQGKRSNAWSIWSGSFWHGVDLKSWEM